jgi:hypothetical protein
MTTTDDTTDARDRRRTDATTGTGSGTATGTGTGTGTGGGPGTMRGVDHTHPETDEAFWTTYRRGPTATDGGPRPGDRDGDRSRADDADADGSPDRDRDTVRDVDHDGPDGVDSGAVWQRGEGEPADPHRATVDREEPVDADVDDEVAE